MRQLPIYHGEISLTQSVILTDHSFFCELLFSAAGFLYSGGFVIYNSLILKLAC